MTTATMQRYGFELRTKVEGRTIRGHAAVFGQVARVPGGYERLAPTAFDAVLAREDTDVRALFNHDPALLLGRQSAGTLRLDVDERGLAMEIDVPETSYGDDLLTLVRRGDLTGASFGFVPGEDAWSKAPDGLKLRDHTSLAELRDVSPVAFPAYDGTEVALRSVTFDHRRLNPRAAVIRSRARARGLHPGRKYR